MTVVKNPILLDANLRDADMLWPTKGNLTLRMCGVSECSLTLPENVTVGMHAWVKVFNQNGFVGYFRKTSNNRGFPAESNSIDLKHGIDILQDSIWDAETDFSGTKKEFLTALLAKQTALIQRTGDSAPRAPWVLETCEDTGTYKKKVSYNDLLSLLQELEDEGGDYYFRYDQTVWPWTVSYVAKPSAVASEFRLSRNMEKCTISENDAELCTRLILNINGPDGAGGSTSIYKPYNNTAAQAVYGIIVKTADIDVTQDTLPGGPYPESDAYAAKYLADRAAPINTVTIDGHELKKYTGALWDEAQIGTKCRVAMPDYGTYIAERVTTVSYPDMFGDQDRVTVTLSNATPKDLREKETFSTSVASTQHEVARGGGGSRKQSREINMNADKISLVVQDKSGGGYEIKAAGIWMSIDTALRQSQIRISADIIDLDGYVTMQSFNALSGSVDGILAAGTFGSNSITSTKVNATGTLAASGTFNWKGHTIGTYSCKTTGGASFQALGYTL